MLNPQLDLTLLSRIEDAGLNASAPPQQRWLDGWILRYSPGKAKRARCVNAVAPGRQPAALKLEQCERVFADAGLPLIVRITPFTQPAGLDALLDAQGLRSFDDTRVMVMTNVTALPSAPALPTGLALSPVSLDTFAQHVGALRGSPLAQRQAHSQRLANAPVPFNAFTLRDESGVLCCGQYALENGLVGLYDIYTASPARRQGLASLLCEHLLAHARDHGAQHAYLQVESTNAEARAIYHRMGFVDAYAYHYRTRDPAAA
jgi:GNAT superfamily N-acetyltransferase